MDYDQEAHSIYLPESVESYKNNLRGRLSQLTLHEARKQLQVCLYLNPECQQDQAYLSKLQIFLEKKIKALEQVQTIERAVNRSQRHLNILKGNIRIIQADEQAKKIMSHRSSLSNSTDCTQELDHLLNIIKDEREYILDDGSDGESSTSAYLVNSMVEENEDSMSSLVNLDERQKKRINKQSKNLKLAINLKGLFDKEKKLQCK